MSLGLRLCLLPLLVAGCAAERLVVPDSDWNTVPAAKRAAVDRQMASDTTAAQAELTAASAGLAELERAPAATGGRATGTAVAAPTADDDKEWANALRSHERARRDAFARVEAARATWQSADRSWRQLRVAAAKERLEVLSAQRELVRAQTIDHNLPGTDHYDVAPLRGQFSQAQQRWYAVDTRARAARTALEKASASLASAKEAYAQLMRNGPAGIAPPPAVAAEDHPALQLTSWHVARTDIRRRRGLRHFLESGGAPQLRNPPAHPAALWIPTPRPAPTTSPDAIAKPGAPASPAAGGKAAPVAPPSAASAAPAAPPAASSSGWATTARPTPPTSPAATRPAPAAAGAGAAATAPAPSSGKPATPAGAGEPRPGAAPAPASTVGARPPAAKPAGPASNAAAARPAPPSAATPRPPTGAAPASATASAKPASSAPAGAAGKPAADARPATTVRSNAPASAAPVAKPVD